MAERYPYDTKLKELLRDLTEVTKRTAIAATPRAPPPEAKPNLCCPFQHPGWLCSQKEAEALMQTVANDALEETRKDFTDSPKVTWEL